MRRFRVNGKKAKSKKRRVIEKVAAYKCIPRHMHIISFEHMLFVNQRVNSENVFYISFCKDMTRHFVTKLYKSKCFMGLPFEMLSLK